ncbi:MAG: helix-turn-helix domain-containing protein [bacterium]
MLNIAYYMDINLLKSLGFSDKLANIYLALLSLGPSSVRKIAEKTDLNRGTVYDNLKWLKDKGLVGFYKKEKKQLFVVEDPEKLHGLVLDKSEELEEIDKKLDKMIPELRSIYDKGGERPIARYYNKNQIVKIMEDLLDVCENSGEKIYRIYSSAGIREYLYDGFETFSDVRISKGIAVKVIAIGDGGELRGMDERKWLSAEDSTPTYILIYPGKTAYISLNAKDEPVGVVVENEGIFQTQKNIFDNLWNKL